jgi:hypothetical protein
MEETVSLSAQGRWSLSDHKRNTIGFAHYTHHM